MYAFTEIPSYFFAAWIIDLKKIGRSRGLALVFILCSLGVLLGTFTDKEKYQKAIPFLLAFGRFSVACAYGIFFNYTAELFPTSVRGNAIGICSMMSRIGAIVVPLLLNFQKIYHWIPGVIFSAFSLTAALVALSMPDTRGIPMLETFKAADKFYKKKSFCKKNIEY